LGKRHQARELALKVLFQLEGTGDEVDDVLSYHASENGAGEEIANFARQLVDGVIANQVKLDSILSEASEHWKLDQMAKVDRIILRIAVYEIAIDRRVPTKAAINESIELGRRSRPFRQRHPRQGGCNRDLSQPRELDDLLADLETTMGKLADGTAPLDDLVAAHQRAVRLLAEAQARLAELRARADETSKLLTG